MYANMGDQEKFRQNVILDQRSYSDETTGFCIDAADVSVYNLRIFPYVIDNARVGYIFKVNNKGVTPKESTLDKYNIIYDDIKEKYI